jgi:hypothetical protein
MATPPPIAEQHLINVIRKFPPEIQRHDSQRAFWLSVAVIKHFLGLEWATQHMSPENSAPGFLRVIPGSGPETQMSTFKVVDLAELLWNLQTTPGLEICLDRLRRADIESKYAELDLARMLYCASVDFHFVRPEQKKGSDYDIEIFLKDWTVCADAKCKIETTDFSIRTVENSLADARKQFPRDRPSFVFVKVPARWLSNLSVAVALLDIGRTFLRQTGRIVSVKYYASHLVQRDGILGHTHVFKEISNPRNRFDPNRDWDVFAEPPQKESWNGMPPRWKRLLFFLKRGPNE